MNMDQSIILTVIEFILSLILEGVILGFIFQQISNKSQDKQEKKLTNEMNNIETQNRHNTELIIEELKEIKIDLISQIKESEVHKK